MNSALITFLMTGLALTPAAAIFADQTASTSATAATNAAAPQISLQAEAYNFGKLTSGDLAKHDFIFTNTGQSVLIVSNVTPACHCTTAGAWTREVQPGKTGIIPLQFDSTTFNGPITRTVTAYCNDPRHPIFSLSMSGTVWRPIEISPINAIFNLASDVEFVAPIVMHITNNSDEPVTISDPDSPNHAFAAELKVIKTGREYELIVKIKGPVGTTSVSGMITMKTSSPRVPSLTTSVFAIIHPAVMVVPAQVSLLPGPLAVPVTNFITIQNSSTNIPSLALSELTAPDRRVDVQMKENQPGKAFTLTVVFPAGYQIPSGLAELTVKSTHPQFKLIKIPIVQPVQPPVIAAPRQLAPPPAIKAPALPTAQAVKGQ